MALVLSKLFSKMHDCVLLLCLLCTITVIGISGISSRNNSNNIFFVQEEMIDEVQKSAPKQNPRYQQPIMFVDIANSTANDANPVTSVETSNEERRGNDFVGDMDLSKQLACGNQKCFVPSISDEKVGYLVDKDPYEKTRMSQLSQANEVAKWIDRDLREGMHFHLGETFTAHLNKTVVNQIFKLADVATKKQRHSLESRTVAVQKMKKAPKDTLIVGCYYWHLKKFRRGKDPFLKKVNEAGNIKEFMENIMMGQSIMEKALKAKPNLVFDFQAMVDLNGNLYFIDLDGHLQFKAGKKYCPEGSGPPCSNKCLGLLNKHLISPMRKLLLAGS